MSGVTCNELQLQLSLAACCLRWLPHNRNSCGPLPASCSLGKVGLKLEDLVGPWEDYQDRKIMRNTHGQYNAGKLVTSWFKTFIKVLTDGRQTLHALREDQAVYDVVLPRIFAVIRNAMTNYQKSRWRACMRGARVCGRA